LARWLVISAIGKAGSQEVSDVFEQNAQAWVGLVTRIESYL